MIDSTKAAPADKVGELKGDLVNLSITDEVTNQHIALLENCAETQAISFSMETTDNPIFYVYGANLYGGEIGLAYRFYLKKGDKFTVSLPEGQTFPTSAQIWLHDSNKNKIDYWTLEGNSRTITNDVNASYFSIRYSNQISNIMVNIGDKALPYEEYVSKPMVFAYNNILSGLSKFSLFKGTNTILNTLSLDFSIKYFKNTEEVLNAKIKIAEERVCSDKAEPLNNKWILNFGDSIFGNYNDDTSISAVIKSNSNAKYVWNLGFGGCRMSQYPTSTIYDAFSMCRLADAIYNNDFSIQEVQALNASASYFVGHVNLLKIVEWDKVDMITIAYGCNDVTNTVLVDNPNNKEDTTTYCGALRYSLRRITEKYPHIKIVVLTPIFEVYLNNGVYDYDSDDENYGTKRGFTQVTDRKFRDYVNGAISVCKEFHVYCVNEYDELGFNKYNYSNYYEDGTHLNEKGRKLRGERLAHLLSSVY